MTALVVEIDRKESDDGPAMMALLPRERAFVIAMTLAGAAGNQTEKCALAAGYSDGKYGWELVRKKKIIEAMREEAGKKLFQGVLVGAQALLEIVQDPNHRDRFKAAQALLAHSGYTVEQKIKVEHEAGPDTRRMIEDVKALAKQIGLDPKHLLGQAGVIIDADYEVVSRG